MAGSQVLRGERGRWNLEVRRGLKTIRGVKKKIPVTATAAGIFCVFLEARSGLSDWISERLGRSFPPANEFSNIVRWYRTHRHAKLFPKIYRYHILRMRQVFSNAWAMISREYWMAAMISAPYRECLQIPQFENAIGLLDCLGDDLSGVLDSGHDLCSCKKFCMSSLRIFASCVPILF